MSEYDIECPSCGAAVDAVKNGRCPNCGRDIEYD